MQPPPLPRADVPAPPGFPAVPPLVIVSCEHAGDDIPAPYMGAFHVPQEILASHRGIDIGSLDYGRDLSSRVGATFIVERVTRLLVDTNRSAENPERLSEFSRRMPTALMEKACREIWAVHRGEVTAEVHAAVELGRRVVHLGAHTFTPVWKGRERAVDIGLLFDPERHGETEFAETLKRQLERQFPGLRIRRNEPYHGTDDGLTRTLRELYTADVYAGLELEVSQRFPEDRSPQGALLWQHIRTGLAEAVASSLPDARR